VAGGFVCLSQAHAALGDEDRARALLDEAWELSKRWGYPAEANEAKSAMAGISASTSRA
jgi:hypothetical protein